MSAPRPRGGPTHRLGLVRIGLLSAVLLPASAASAQTPPPSDAHHAGVDARGDHVMGFDHSKTTHHFRLTKTGGFIEVSADDSADAASRDAIREHLAHIAHKFSQGDFEAPMLIHDREPPGVPVLKERKARIRWTFEATPSGGRVRITTKDAKALAAVHEFLRFQIQDHRTGDPTEIAD